jgi:hypothetical protein
MTMNAPLLPLLAFLCIRTGEHKSVVVDGRYLAGRRVVLLPRFSMFGEHDYADAIGLEYGQAVEFRGDLVIGTTEQLKRLRSLYESYRAEEANDPEAVEFWEGLIQPLSADIETAPDVEPDPTFGEGWIAWYSRRERSGSLPLR